MDPIERTGSEVPNGAAVAAYLGAAVGAFAMGLVVILNEAGIFAAPSLYGPAGGVSGRTTIAVVIWLIGWIVLHQRWKNRQVETHSPWLLSMILIGLGILFTFPPFWRLIP
jgi:hypothetical protein